MELDLVALLLEDVLRRLVDVLEEEDAHVARVKGLQLLGGLLRGHVARAERRAGRVEGRRRRYRQAQLVGEGVGKPPGDVSGGGHGVGGAVVSVAVVSGTVLLSGSDGDGGSGRRELK